MSSPSTIFNITRSEQSPRYPSCFPMPDRSGFQDMSRVDAGESRARRGQPCRQQLPAVGLGATPPPLKASWASSSVKGVKGDQTCHTSSALLRTSAGLRSRPC